MDGLEGHVEEQVEAAHISRSREGEERLVFRFPRLSLCSGRCKFVGGCPKEAVKVTLGGYTKKKAGRTNSWLNKGCLSPQFPRQTGFLQGHPNGLEQGLGFP